MSSTAITTIPVRQRVDFKIVVLVFQCLTGHATAYLADDCQLAAQPTRRSALSVARRPTTTSNGDRCFASAGPRLWNTLPLNLRLCDSLGQFKRSLKTFLLGCETTAPCDTSFKARRIEKRWQQNCFYIWQVIRKKWWYGFKPVKEEIPVCLTSPYSHTSSTDPNLIQGDDGYSSAALSSLSLSMTLFDIMHMRAYLSAIAMTAISLSAPTAGAKAFWVHFEPQNRVW